MTRSSLLAPPRGAPALLSTEAWWAAAVATPALSLLLLTEPWASAVTDPGEADDPPDAAAPEAPVQSGGPTVAIVIAVDARASMKPGLDAARRLVRGVATAMRGQDLLGVVVVRPGDRSEVEVPLAPAFIVRRELASPTFPGMQPSTTDPEFDRGWRWSDERSVMSTIEAGERLLERSAALGRVIVVADGRDVGWGEAEHQASAAGKRGIRVSAVGASDFLEGYLKSVARAGHGRFVDGRDTDALDAFAIGEARWAHDGGAP